MEQALRHKSRKAKYGRTRLLSVWRHCVTAGSCQEAMGFRQKTDRATPFSISQWAAAMRSPGRSVGIRDAQDIVQPGKHAQNLARRPARLRSPSFSASWRASRKMAPACRADKRA